MNYFLLIMAVLLIFFISLLPIIFICIILKRKLVKGLKYTLIISLSILQLWIFYSAFTAFYPEDSFYTEEYKTVIGIAAPASAKIVKKSASYPDLHGDYCSASLMELSVGDYKRLYEKISNDKSFYNADFIYSDTLNDILDKEQIKNIIMIKQHKTNYVGQNCYIGFLNDRKSILIYFVNS
ncbi:hypothetical protein SRABI27_00355 [Pedobacter sp. Bi27]|uniref:hypothetical protein n=1 Tax=unclassified Pedobacter TaxID=2628915 RepID=UPI001DF0ED01|nr:MULTISPECIES: hypothetical protein [unclassified Pedobacter]CAH0143772.1 hypothetical protein SRABI126_00360 [Pedobacter sp. Bi126]CAH0144169.1 hypothetical protein SRABI27_00355 [Pedobacter sp. Bi27]CAH0214565.1 hypothetical protein SRABI36_02321 [Pedobacter sp. Bi36]